MISSIERGIEVRKLEKTNSVIGRWTGKDSQIQPGEGIKHVGPVNQIRHITINDDNLKNKDPKGINLTAPRASKVTRSFLGGKIKKRMI